MPSLVFAQTTLFSPEYDWLWRAFMIMVAGFMFAALVDVMRTATFLRAVEWVALIVVVPIVGPTIWFVYGRNRFLA